jgi:hypothetical protein
MTSVGIAIGNDLAVCGLADAGPETPTRLYLTSDSVGAYDPVTRRGAWDKTTSTTVHRLAPVKAGKGIGATNSENNVAGAYDVLISTFVSEPLATNKTINGDLTGVLLVNQSNDAADMVAHIHAWVTQGESATVRGTLLSDFIGASEWVTSNLNINYSGLALPSQVLTPVAAQAGDRIVIEIGYRAGNTVTTSYTGGLVIGGRDGDADGTESALTANIQPCPWVQFEQTLTFQGTALYTTSSAAPVTPASSRGTWDVNTFNDNFLFGLTKAGTSATESKSETVTTNPYDVALQRFVSPALAAQTIPAQDVHMILRVTEGSGSADAFAKVHLYVMAPDESVRGTLIANTVDGTELNNLGTVCPDLSVAISSLAVQEGDRLVFELGARFTNVTATSMQVTAWAGLTETDAGVSSLGSSPATSSCSGVVRFEQTLSFAA